MTFYLDILRFEFGEFSVSDLPGIAARGLEQGYDSSGLRILAAYEGTPYYPSEIRVAYDRTIRELGLAIPSRRDIAIELIEETLRQVVSGDIAAHEGAKRVAIHLYYATVPEGWVGKYVGDAIGIAALYGLQDTVDDLRESHHRWQEAKTNAELEVELLEQIRNEAARLLRERPWVRPN